MAESPVKVNLEGDANKFVDQIKGGIGDIAEQLKVNASLIFNNSSKPVNFYVYNYADSVFWISAMHTMVAPNKVGKVAASGVAFKVHPDDNKDHEFLVEPHKAYIYWGPGSIDEIRK